MSASLPLPRIVDRGVEPYDVSYAAMKAFTAARDHTTPDELWLVEHPPVYTLGLAADRSHILAPGTIPVIQTDRGGEVTYHGPGQAVVYLLFDLRRHRPGARLFVREFVFRVEQAVLDTLAQYGIEGVRKDGAPGIYLASGAHAGAKIAALGIKIRGNGSTYHGVALNVDMDLRPFHGINPCGYEGLETIDMRTAGVETQLHPVRQKLAQALIAQFAALPHDTTHSNVSAGQDLAA